MSHFYFFILHLFKCVAILCIDIIVISVLIYMWGFTILQTVCHNTTEGDQPKLESREDITFSH
jgi:hypothetical protein